MSGDSNEDVESIPMKAPQRLVLKSICSLGSCPALQYEVSHGVCSTPTRGTLARSLSTPM